MTKTKGETMEAKDDKNVKETNYYLQIPISVALDNDLSSRDKLLYPVIKFLDMDDGCFASNGYLAAYFDVTESCIQKSISNLKNQGYIQQKSFDGRTRILIVTGLAEKLNKRFIASKEERIKKFKEGRNKRTSTNNKSDSEKNTTPDSKEEICRGVKECDIVLKEEYEKNNKKSIEKNLSKDKLVSEAVAIQLSQNSSFPKDVHSSDKEETKPLSTNSSSLLSKEDKQQTETLDKNVSLRDQFKQKAKSSEPSLKKQVKEILDFWNNCSLAPVKEQYMNAVVGRLEKVLSGTFFGQYTDYEGSEFDRILTKEEIIQAIKNHDLKANNKDYYPVEVKMKKSLKSIPLLSWLYNASIKTGERSLLIKNITKPATLANSVKKETLEDLPELELEEDLIVNTIKADYAKMVLGGDDVNFPVASIKKFRLVKDYMIQFLERHRRKFSRRVRAHELGKYAISAVINRWNGDLSRVTINQLYGPSMEETLLQYLRANEITNNHETTRFNQTGRI